MEHYENVAKIAEKVLYELAGNDLAKEVAGMGRWPTRLLHLMSDPRELHTEGGHIDDVSSYIAMDGKGRIGILIEAESSYGGHYDFDANCKLEHLSLFYAITKAHRFDTDPVKINETIRREIGTKLEQRRTNRVDGVEGYF